LRIVVIGRVLDDPANVVSSAWCRLLSAANRCRIEGNQFVIAPECTNGTSWLVHLDPGHLPSGPTVGNVGNGYNRPGAVKCLAGVEQLDRLLAGVEFFRQKLRCAPVAELAKAGHAFKIAGYLGQKWPANIVVCDCVRKQGRSIRGFAKLVPGRAIELAARRE